MEEGGGTTGLHQEESTYVKKCVSVCVVTREKRNQKSKGRTRGRRKVRESV
jgi:hypothetical protein